MFKKLLALTLTVALLLITTSACSYGEKKQENSSHSQSAIQNSKKEKNYTVVFKDFDGKAIKEENVEHGGQASPPVGLKRDGYKFSKWDKSIDKITGDLVVNAVYEKIEGPTLIADTIYAKGKDAIVSVKVKNNPGILSLLINTIYVENVMTLKKIENGNVMKDYSFVEPKNLSSACNVAWYINDIPKKVEDGEVLKLHFELKDNTVPGTYEISISCNGGAFDKNYNEIDFDIIKGYIITEG